jgi:hypothetical protein
MASDKDDRNINIGEFALEFESAQSRQTHVEYQACRPVWPLE